MVNGTPTNTTRTDIKVYGHEITRVHDEHATRIANGITTNAHTERSRAHAKARVQNPDQKERKIYHVQRGTNIIPLSHQEWRGVWGGERRRGGVFCVCV